MLLAPEIKWFRLGATSPDDICRNWWSSNRYADQISIGHNFTNRSSVKRCGPIRDSWSAGRRIVTGSAFDPIEGERWGATEASWKEGEREREALQEETATSVIASDVHQRVYRKNKAMMEVAPGLFDAEIFAELTDEDKRCVDA